MSFGGMNFNPGFLSMATQFGQLGNTTFGAQLRHLMDDIKNMLGGQNQFGGGAQNQFGNGSMEDPFQSGMGGSQDPFGLGGMQNPFQSGMGGFGGQTPFGFGCPSQQQSPWTVTNQGSGQDQIDLGNYTLNCTNGTSWSLTNKTTGATTQVSGDPHATSPDGQHWDFKQNLSFQLDDGTRITVKTVPAGNGATLSSELDITKGGHGMKVTGINGGSLQVSDGLNGYGLAAANEGTDEIYEAGTGWQTFDGREITGSLASQLGL